MPRLANAGAVPRSGPATTVAAAETAAVLLVTYVAASLVGRVVSGASPVLADALVHVPFLVVPSAWLWATGRDLRGWFGALAAWREQMRIGLTSYLPAALAGAVAGAVDARSWPGAVALAAAFAAALWVIVRQRVPNPRSGAVTIALSVVLFTVFAVARGRPPEPAHVLAVLATYGVLVAFGEEALYRGFVQPRLDAALGTPYSTGGVRWGWGLVLTALLFGLSHTGLAAWVLRGVDAWVWPWGVWTFASGLLFGFVRAKSGGILAPALLHGLPQALALALLSV